MIFTFTIMLSLMFASPKKEYPKSDSSEAKRFSADIKGFPDSLQTHLFEIPSKQKDFIYTPPSGINYKTKIFNPDSTIDYKIKKYYYRDDKPFLNKNYPLTDSLRKYLKDFVPQTK